MTGEERCAAGPTRASGWTTITEWFSKPFCNTRWAGFRSETPPLTPLSACYFCGLGQMTRALQTHTHKTNAYSSQDVTLLGAELRSTLVFKATTSPLFYHLFTKHLFCHTPFNLLLLTARHLYLMLQLSGCNFDHPFQSSPFNFVTLIGGPNLFHPLPSTLFPRWADLEARVFIKDKKLLRKTSC